MASSSMTLSVFGKTHPGRVRKNNEDAFAVSSLDSAGSLKEFQQPHTIDVGERGVLLAVSDGLGGERAGEVASALALHCLRLSLADTPIDSAEAALTRSVEAANHGVWKAAEHPARRGMGATLTAAFLLGSRAYIAEIGDSRAYLLRQNRLWQLTRDQSYAELMVEAGMLRREQIQNFVYRNVVLQALGTRPEVLVGLNRVRLRHADSLLLCSDGLSTKLKDEEMRAVLAGASGPSEACEELIQLANERGGEDNITVVLAEVSGEALGFPASDRISLENIHEPELMALALKK